MSNNLNRILRLNALQSDSCNPGIKILRQNYFKWVNLISSSILTPRPNSYCSVYTIPADLFQEEELEVTSLSEEPVTAIIQWEIFQKLISKHSRTSDKFHRSIWTINGAKHHFNKNWWVRHTTMTLFTKFKTDDINFNKMLFSNIKNRIHQHQNGVQ